MPPERIGSNRGIQYSKKSYPYGHVDSSKIFYIIRDGFSEREAIIEIVSKIWTIRQKILGRHLWVREYCLSTVGLNEQQIREYVKWQEKREKEIEKKQLTMFNVTHKTRGTFRASITSHHLWWW